MKRYFVVSDVHSFYNELKSTLDNCGFDINNQDHIFILCGDLFDRGTQSRDLYDFVKSIPNDRRILIRGNHEYLLKELLEKEFPESYDFSNGTVRTVCNMVGADETLLKDVYSYFSYCDNDVDSFNYWKGIVRDFNKLKITDWIFSNEWIDYFELDNLIFVHSFIPLDDDSNLPSYYIRGHNYKYNSDWRKFSKGDIKWEDASWGCPWQLYSEGLFKEEEEKGKTLVCGHWHSNDFHKKFEEDYNDNNEMYIGKHLIALDSCTVLSKFVNCLVLDVEENKIVKMYDRNMNII